jgi:hypothetical protein
MGEKTKTVKVVKTLRYTFTQAERQEFGDSMAQAVAGIEREQDQLKQVKKDFESRIADHEGNMKRCAERLRSGYEFRPVECEKVLDFKLGNAIITRTDTGEIVEERPLTDDERQDSLSFEGEGND